MCGKNALFAHVELTLLLDHQYWVCIQVEARWDPAVPSVRYICNYIQHNTTNKAMKLVLKKHLTFFYILLTVHLNIFILILTNLMH